MFQSEKYPIMPTRGVCLDKFHPDSTASNRTREALAIMFLLAIAPHVKWGAKPKPRYVVQCVAVGNDETDNSGLDVWGWAVVDTHALALAQEGYNTPDVFAYVTLSAPDARDRAKALNTSAPAPCETPVYLNMAELGALTFALEAWAEAHDGQKFSKAYASAYSKVRGANAPYVEGAELNRPYVKSLSGEEVR